MKEILISKFKQRFNITDPINSVDNGKEITLFANGCSHTSGSEIEFEYQGYCYEKAWPRWLADDKGWNWVNVAEPGAGNEQIRRTTFEWIAKNIEIEKKYNSDNLIVMIMWSGFNRFEAWSTTANQLRSQSGLTDLSQEAPELQEYAKFRTMVDLPEVNEYKNLLEVYTTAKYLESLNIKYYFSNALYAWPTIQRFNGNSWLRERYDTIYRAYGDRVYRHLGFHNQEERFWQYLKPYPYSQYAKCGHWGVDGQQAWKDYLKQWMDKIDA